MWNQSCPCPPARSGAWSSCSAPARPPAPRSHYCCTAGTNALWWRGHRWHRRPFFSWSRVNCLSNNIWVQSSGRQGLTMKVRLPGMQKLQKWWCTIDSNKCLFSKKDGCCTSVGAQLGFWALMKIMLFMSKYQPQTKPRHSKHKCCIVEKWEKWVRFSTTQEWVFSFDGIMVFSNFCWWFSASDLN